LTVLEIKQRVEQDVAQGVAQGVEQDVVKAVAERLLIINSSVFMLELETCSGS
jgi:hypothetical protein